MGIAEPVTYAQACPPKICKPLIHLLVKHNKFLVVADQVPKMIRKEVGTIEADPHFRLGAYSVACFPFTRFFLMKEPLFLLQDKTCFNSFTLAYEKLAADGR